MQNEMVENQIKRRGIKDVDVLKAMKTVPRHHFVPHESKKYAYDDFPLAIGEGQTISQPYIVALMTELTDLSGNEKVLEIGTGSGYQGAILAQIVKEVFSIEIIEGLAKSAQNTLRKLNYLNIRIKVGDGFYGWSEEAPFDVIIVTCAPLKIPQPLVDQLNVGRRLVIPVGDSFQELSVIKKTSSGFVKTGGTPVQFVPMTGVAQKN